MSTSSSGGIGNVLVVDANVLMAVLLGGRAAELLLYPGLTLLTTLRTTWEVERYIPMLVRRLARRGVVMSELELEEDFKQMPITVFPESFYRDCVQRAGRLIARRDPKDTDLLALTLRLGVPLWTNDRHFDGIAEIRTVTTAQLLAMLSP